MPRPFAPEFKPLPPAEIPLPVSLRDYFAAKAMAAAISTSAAPFMFRDHNVVHDRIAEMAYTQADAMLRARKAHP